MMQNKTKWMTWMGLGAVVVASAAGCGNKEGADDGVSPAIQSPTMNQADDKAVAGTDNGSTDNGAMGNGAMGNSAMGNSASGGKMSGGAMNNKMKGQAVPKPMTGNSTTKQQ